LIGIRVTRYKTIQSRMKTQMIQNDLTKFYENTGPTPQLIKNDGSVEELNLVKLKSSSYLCLIVLRFAFEEHSTSELVAFCNTISQFRDLGCQVVGASRDSPMTLQEWQMDIKLGTKKRKNLNSVKIPLISDQNLGQHDFGFIQALGVPLVDGFPIPSIIITDKEDKIRYFANFDNHIPRNPEEILRIVAAIKIVDDANGTELAPADWVPGEPTIRNTKAGVEMFYKELYNEETSDGMFAFLEKMFSSVYDSLFGSSSTGEASKKVEVANRMIEDGGKGKVITANSRKKKDVLEAGDRKK